MFLMQARVTKNKNGASIGSKIKEFRIKRGLPQKELAEALGIHSVTISEYERGKTRVPAELVSKFAEVLEIDIEEILGQAKPGKLDTALYRRLKKVENLPIHQKQAVLDNLDIFLRGLIA